MNIVFGILIAIAGIIVLLLIAAALMKKEHYVNREIIINAPVQKVFSFLRLIKNQDKFNKWARTDENRKEEFKGMDGTAGYVYSWSGDRSAGVGEKEIISISEERRVETEIRFTKPMKISARVIMETEALPGDRTKVNFINKGDLRFPLNIMIPIAEKNFARDIDESLAKLKEILEKDATAS